MVLDVITIGLSSCPKDSCGERSRRVFSVEVLCLTASSLKLGNERFVVLGGF